MRKQSIAGMLLIVVGLFSGCGSTVSSGENSEIIIKSSTKDITSNTLDTLSLSSVDIQKELQKKPWRVIKADISAFYENSLYSTGMKRYLIELSFQDKRIVAYADCQKIMAHYQIDAKHIAFSKLSVTSAIDLASCMESEYADDAVITFLENSFNIEKITEDEVFFSADDFDTSVILTR